MTIDRPLLTNYWLWFAVALTAIAASRVPFISMTSYGTDADASRMATVARHFAETGEYTASRNPGHPVQEIFYGLLPSRNPIWLNVPTAILSVAAAAFFGLLLRDLGLAGSVWAMAAFAFAPVVFINSTIAMDFVWGLSFALACLYCARRGMPILTGVLLALSVGARVTSGVFGLPALVFLVADEYEWKLRHGWMTVAARFFLSTGATTVIVFLPVWLRYGWEMFDSGTAGNPPLKMVQYLTASIWGILGLATVVAAAVYWVVRVARKKPALVQSVPRTYVAAILATIAIYVLWFLAYAGKAAYLIPLVPMTLILGAAALPMRAYRIACGLLMVSPFVLGMSARSYLLVEPPTCARITVEAGAESIEIFPFYGQALLDDLREEAESTNVAYLGGLDLPDNALVVSFVYLVKIEALMPDAVSKYTYLLTHEEMEAARRAGKRIYYLRDAAPYNLRIAEADLAAEGAEMIRLPHSALDLYRDEADQSGG